MVIFESVYGKLITQYISFKRSLGYKYRSAEFRFRVFDKFALQENVSEAGLTKELFEKWAQLNANESDSSRYRRVNELLNFSRFLNDLGITSYCPRNIPHTKSSFVPYIFTHDEIVRFFAVCDEAVDFRRPCAEFSYAAPALFRLLYGTGLRIGEALQLEAKDVHLAERYIVLHHTKNNTDRMVPFSKSVGSALKQYVNFRNSIFGANAKYFFAHARDAQWSQNVARSYFRKVLTRAGIPHSKTGPRLHDFRHTFSVHTLAELSSQGLDLYYSLPILSKYLGHTSLEATDQYVRLTAEMYPELLRQANQLCSYVFPEVNPSEE